jgi:hypothetical protein
MAGRLRCRLCGVKVLECVLKTRGVPRGVTLWSKKMPAACMLLSTRCTSDRLPVKKGDYSLPIKPLEPVTIILFTVDSFVLTFSSCSFFPPDFVRPRTSDLAVTAAQIWSLPMKGSAKRKCLCCGDFFAPDHRNVRHQRYCSKPACRKESEAQSRRRWPRKAKLMRI